MGIFIASSHPIPVGRVPLLAPPWLKPLINPLVHAPAIEDEYSGPKLEDGKVTITFMKELMQWYKEQKKLHRKCAYQVTHTPETREWACHCQLGSENGRECCHFLGQCCVLGTMLRVTTCPHPIPQHFVSAGQCPYTSADPGSKVRPSGRHWKEKFLKSMTSVREDIHGWESSQIIEVIPFPHPPS